MLDIKFVRENPEIVKQNIRNKFQDKKLHLVDEVIELDKKNREIKQEVEALRASRNKLSKEIGALMAQKKKEEAEEVKKQVASQADRMNELSEEEKKAAVKDFNFPKGLAIALLAGFMSGCFNVGLAFGEDIHFGTFTPDMFKTLPATFLVTVGGFITNAIYCFYQNTKNHTWSDYKNEEVWSNNILYCALAGALWYSQFFGLSLGKGFLTESPTLMTLSFCILMALNVVFSNVWGIILKEWKGCSKKTIGVLIVGIIVLIISSFLPQLV